MLGGVPLPASRQGVAGAGKGAIISVCWPGRGGGIGRHAVLRGQWACACVGSNPALGTTNRSGDPRPRSFGRLTTRRRSQAVKAEVCKTSMRRFEPARRLQYLSPHPCSSQRRDFPLIPFTPPFIGAVSLVGKAPTLLSTPNNSLGRMFLSRAPSSSDNTVTGAIEPFAQDGTIFSLSEKSTT